VNTHFGSIARTVRRNHLEPTTFAKERNRGGGFIRADLLQSRGHRDRLGLDLVQASGQNIVIPAKAGIQSYCWYRHLRVSPDHPWAPAPACYPPG